MFASGAALGPLCDGQHSSHDVLHYAAPIIVQVGGRNLLETCWWVPLLFGVAGVVIGVPTTLLDTLLLAGVEKKEQQQEPWQSSVPRTGVRPSWGAVLACIAAFVLQYAASGALEQPLLGSRPALDALMLATGAALWWLWDGTKQGLFMAALTAVSGPAIEIALINWFGLYSYSHPDAWGVPFWIPFVYFGGAPAVGLLARRVKADLARA